MPSAHAILWFLGIFLALWAVSLAARGWLGDRSRGRRRCPACAKPIEGAGVRTCAACGYEAVNERALLATRRNWRMIAAGVVLAPVGAGVCGVAVKVWAWSHQTYDVSFALTMWDSSAVALAVFGLLLVGWALRGDRSRGRRRCPSCWYDMTGSGLRCPECGHGARHVSGLYRARRRWKIAAAASLLILAGAVVHGVPLVQRGGWRAAFPSTILIAGLPWLPDALAFKEDPNAEENWTLLARWESDQLWGWQEAWLRRRARGTVSTATTARQVLRGLHFDPMDNRQPEMRRAVGLCLAGLSSSSQSEREAAQMCLSSLEQAFGGPSAESAALVRPLLPGLMRIVETAGPTPDVVWAAAWGVMLAGPEGAPAVPGLLRFAAANWGTRGGRLGAIGGLMTLRKLVVAAPRSRAEIIRALDDPDSAVVEAACWLLAHPSLCDRAAAERLLWLMDEGSDSEAAAAAVALGRAGWDSRVTVPAILEQAQSNRTTRARLIDALWNYGDELLPYLDRFAELLQDPDPTVRTAALGVITACERDGAFHVKNSALYPIIASMKEDPDANVSQAATTIIQETGPQTVP